MPPEHEHELKESLIKVQGQLERIALDLVLIKDVLLGGSNPEKGLVLRFDRLEQSHKRMGKLMWLMVGVILTAGAAVIQAKFFK